MAGAVNQSFRWEQVAFNSGSISDRSGSEPSSTLVLGLSWCVDCHGIYIAALSDLICYFPHASADEYLSDWKIRWSAIKGREDQLSFNWCYKRYYSPGSHYDSRWLWKWYSKIVCRSGSRLCRWNWHALAFKSWTSTYQIGLETRFFQYTSHAHGRNWFKAERTYSLCQMGYIWCQFHEELEDEVKDIIKSDENKRLTWTRTTIQILPKWFKREYCILCTTNLPRTPSESSGQILLLLPEMLACPGEISRDW